MTDENLDDTTLEPTSSVDEAPATPPQYGVGPFTIREIALGGVWLVAFVVSFFPISAVSGPQGLLFGGANVWVSGISWILTIGLPTVAVFLLALRRLSPQGIRRVGSLGIDQFASVAFSVSALVWVTWIWETVVLAVQFGAWARSWVIWVEAVLMLIGVVLTVLAPFLPVVRDDFLGRAEAPAHRNARPVRALSPRPVRERPEPAPAASTDIGYVAGPYVAPTHDTGAVAGVNDTGAVAYDTGAVPQTHETGSYGTGAYDSDATVTSATDVFAPLTDDAAPAQEQAAVDETVASAQPATQAFWALVPVERDVVDDYGNPLFRIGPTAWALVIEDRGEAFVVRHEDGRIGYLHDVSGVTRG